MFLGSRLTIDARLNIRNDRLVLDEEVVVGSCQLGESLEVREGSKTSSLQFALFFYARGMMIIDEVASCAVDHPYGVLSA